MAIEYPMNRVAPVVVALVLLIAGVELALSAAGAGLIGGPAGIGWRQVAIGDWAYSPAVWEQVALRGNRDGDLMKRFVTYAFVHGSFTHAVFGSVMVLALGKFVGDIFHPLAVLAVFLSGTLAGAVVFGLALTGVQPLFGAFPGVYGLIGAFTYVLWLRLVRTGQNQLRAFRLIGMLLVFQLVFGIVFGSDPSWVAEVAGFVAGFVVSILAAPGGFRALQDRLRSR